MKRIREDESDTNGTSNSSVSTIRSSNASEGYPKGSKSSDESGSSGSYSFTKEKEPDLLLKEYFFTPKKEGKKVVYKKDSMTKLTRLKEDPRITALRIIKDFLNSDKSIDKKSDFYQSLLDKILKEEKITKRLLTRDNTTEPKKLLDYYKKYMKVRGLYNRANCDSLQSFPNLLIKTDITKKVSTESPYIKKTNTIESSFKKMKISSRVYKKDDFEVSENNIRRYLINHIKENKSLSEESRTKILKNLQKIMDMSYDTIVLTKALYETKHIPVDDKEISYIIKKTIELRKLSAKNYLKQAQETNRKIRNYNRDELMFPLIKNRKEIALQLARNASENAVRRENAFKKFRMF